MSAIDALAGLSGWELGYCVGVILLAYGLRGGTGFGGAVGMPLLALVLPVKTLVPVWTLLGFTSSLAILGHERRHVDRGAFVAFLPWCALGVVVGLLLFASLDERVLGRALGAAVLLYAAYSLRAGARPPRILGPVAAALSGAVGAMFGAMASVFYGMFLDARRLNREAFRATGSAMLLALSFARGIGYWLAGEFSAESWWLFAAALAPMLAGIYIGDRVTLGLTQVAFRRLVCVTLVLSGIPLLLR
jgi:uncharacterized membrane protein YfcA